MHHLKIKMVRANPGVAATRYIIHEGEPLELNFEALLAGLMYKDHAFSNFTDAVLRGVSARRMARQQGKGPPEMDMSIGDWFRSVTGSPALVDNVISAMVHGIYGGDVDKLSMRSLFPQLWHNFYRKRAKNHVLMPPAEYALMKRLGRAEHVQESAARTAKGLFWPEGGMSSLTNVLIAELKAQTNVTLKYSQPVQGLVYDKARDKVNVRASRHTFHRKYIH
jgi:protoporphyrinogen/coproporphyrinogen III oxidase